MKKRIKTTLRILLMLLISVIATSKSFSQEMTKMCNMTPADLNARYASLSTDADFKLLLEALKEKGWTKVNSDYAAYGFTGNMKDADGKSTMPVEFYVYDFYNKGTNQMGSVLWRNNGKSIYKAYLTFPAGEKEFAKGLESSTEMYAEGGKIQKASSWRSCFKSCAAGKCPGFCFHATIFCLGAVLAAPGAGVAIWIGCAGILCGLCFAVCALNCH